MLEKELKKIYRFFVQQERELYLKINIRLHARKKYEFYSMIELDKELDQLQDLSNFATSLSSYIYINITGMAKILKKFDKKFKKYDLHFTNNFIFEKYQKKNSDLLYIHQYKILDEVGACVEQLNFELEDQYYFLIKNPIKEENNARTSSLYEKIKNEINTNSDQILFKNDIKEEMLINNNEDNKNDIKQDNIISLLSNDENGVIKNKFNILKESINTMEAFYHTTSQIFNVWKRYLKKNDYKSHIYSVKSAGEIVENTDNVNIEKNESIKKKKHYLSNESYWNIRIILAQALIMSICSTYILPTIYCLLKHHFDDFEIDISEMERSFLCGLVISMSPIGGLISMGFSNCIIKKSYKIPMILSSLLSIIGNLLFVIGIFHKSITLICVGRLITGFSLNTPVHRNYLIYFVPKRRMSKYLLYFKLIVLLGNSLGPFLSFICLISLKENNYNNILDDHTLPGWICCFVSIILLIIILIVFSEPLSSKFVIYAEGQAPSDVMKSGGSFSIDNNLTIYEAEKLNEINQKVSHFNDENQFNDTNLVSATINELIDIEIEPYGTVRKAFWTILFNVFILSFTKFCYITMAPAYLYVNIYKTVEASNGQNLHHKEKIICCLYFTSLFLIIPTFCLNFFYLSMRINQIFYIKIASLIFLILEILTTSSVLPSNIFPYIYFFIFLLTILLAYIVEDQLIYFYTHIIPTNFKLGNIEGLTVLHIIKYLGYILGSVSNLFEFFLNEKDEEKNVEFFMIIENCFAMFIQLILLIIFFIYSNRFSDRPIRRILFNKNKREIKITEFS